MSVRESMLEIGRNAILNRAALDGYSANDYDPKQDPEGYIISMLNGLHVWCEVNGINWEGELVRAQGFFEGDDSEPLSKPDISELRCPKCGHEKSFVIEVSECLLMFSDGEVMHGDSGEEWGDWSSCRCHECCHRGTVQQFRKPKQEEGVMSYG